MDRRDFYAHRDPDGRTPSDRIAAHGYRGAVTGETIHWGGAGKATPAQIVEDWMNSAGHRANILRETFTELSGH